MVCAPVAPRAGALALSFALVVSLAVCLAACSDWLGGGANRPDDGELSETHYENLYFGFRLPLPEGWNVVPRSAEEHLRELGQEALAGDETPPDPGAQASLERTYQLLMLAQHPVGTAVPFNPMILVVAEGVGHAPAVQSGGDYLRQLRAILTRSQIAYEPVGEAIPYELGGHTFHRQDFAVAPPSGILQAYVFTRDRDYALGFIVTGRNEAMLDELLQHVSQVEFQ